MFSNDVNTAASSEVSKGDAKGMSKYSFDHPFAINALVKIHLFPLSWPFAVFASLIRLLTSDVQSPNTKIIQDIL